jgi:hypothetical protein
MAGTVRVRVVVDAGTFGIALITARSGAGQLSPGDSNEKEGEKSES